VSSTPRRSHADSLNCRDDGRVATRLSPSRYTVTRMSVSDSSTTSDSTASWQLRTSPIEAGLPHAELGRRPGTTKSATSRIGSGRLRTSLQTVERAVVAPSCEMALAASRRKSV
jgi:hypothetical protein